MNVHAGLRPTMPVELAHQIELCDVSKTFAAVRALDSVSLGRKKIPFCDCQLVKVPSRHGTSCIHQE